MAHRVVETVTRFTPLGVRFWDAGAQRPVREGLRVTAWPKGAAGAAGTTAFRTASGVYAFLGLPGLRDVEWGAAPTSGPGVRPIQQRYLVAVEDAADRFVPTAFEIALPREKRGVFPPAFNGGGFDEPVPGFHLFSAPSRTVPPGLAVVRAQLEDARTGGPAAHAVLEVEVDGETWHGLADASGAVAALFPVPPFHHTLTGEFPEGRVPLHTHTWPLTVRVRYAPAAVAHAPEAGVPLLKSLFDQPAGRLHAVAPGGGAPPAAPTLAATLVYGREAVLRTEGRAALLVAPASS
jgi:hypothetical protein